MNQSVPSRPGPAGRPCRPGALGRITRIFAGGMLGLWLLLACGGCGTPEGMSKMVVTDTKDLPDKWPMPKKVFLTNEVPVIRVIGCEGRHFTVEIADVETGKVVRQHADYFPKHTIQETEDPQLMVGHLYEQRMEPVVPYYGLQTSVQGRSFVLRAPNLPPGSYEARLLVEGTLDEKTGFTVAR